MKKVKNFIAVCLSIIMIVAAVPMSIVVSAQAVSGSCGDNITWEFDTSSGALELVGSGAMPDYAADTVPWYSYRGNIKSVVIGDGITTVGTHAFNSCSAMLSIELPQSVTSIGDNAFAVCRALKSIDLPENLKTIGDSAFLRCVAFTEITIPASVESIGSQAFKYCSYLTAINVDAANADYSSVNGVLFNKAGTELVNYPAGIEGDYTVPEGVTAIGTRAFMGCTGLTGIELPDSLQTMGISAFSGCNSLTSIELNEGLLNIGNNCFDGCSLLEEITIPDTVTYLGKQCFQNDTSLKSVKLSNGLTAIGDYTFSGCTALTEITVPTNITYFNSGAFKGCTAFSDIYYLGTEKQWSNVSVNVNDNEYFTAAKVHCLGDINGDGDVNVLDFISLQKFVVDHNVEIADNSDLNGDSVIDPKDLIVLRKILLGLI